MLRRIDLVLCQFTRRNIQQTWSWTTPLREQKILLRVSFMGPCARVCWNTRTSVLVHILSSIHVTSAVILLRNCGCLYFTELFQNLTKIGKNVGDGGHPYCPHPFSFLPGISIHIFPIHIPASSFNVTNLLSVFHPYELRFSNQI